MGDWPDMRFGSGDMAGGARAAPRQKIGVLTFHRCVNYGSYWQARCLVEGLRARGGEAMLLDHASPAIDRVEWRCALQPQLPRRTRRADLPLYAAKTRAFFSAFQDLPLSPRFALEDGAAADACDLVVVGSDEVWNQRHPWYGGKPLFYGEGLRAGRLVSYAASFGNHDASQGIAAHWAERLRGFDAISVRDENSAALVRTALDREPELVLDPCLQFPPQASPAGEAERPYVAVYGHSFPRWFAEAVRDAARRMGCRLLSIGYRNDWADEQHIDAGPEAFARLMAGSAAVATNFFHGCVFALLNARPFACVGSDYRSNKLGGLTRSLGAEGHLVADDAEPGRFVALLATPLSAEIFRRIEDLRARSSAYLSAAIA